MIKKIIIFIFVIVCIVLFVQKSFSVEIINKDLQQLYNTRQKNENLLFKECVRNCFDDNARWFEPNIRNLDYCLNDINCVECVDECIKNLYEEDTKSAITHATEVTNYCFINSLQL